MPKFPKDHPPIPEWLKTQLSTAQSILDECREAGVLGVGYEGIAYTYYKILKPSEVPLIGVFGFDERI